MFIGKDRRSSRATAILRAMVRRVPVRSCSTMISSDRGWGAVASRSARSKSRKLSDVLEAIAAGRLRTRDKHPNRRRQAFLPDLADPRPPTRSPHPRPQQSDVDDRAPAGGRARRFRLGDDGTLDAARASSGGDRRRNPSHSLRMMAARGRFWPHRPTRSPEFAAVAARRKGIVGPPFTRLPGRADCASRPWLQAGR